MTSTEIRNKFFEFFRSKQHKIVDSAPIVNKDDPSLMFTNAGMNQFKDYFLGNKIASQKRIADTQKCLRVSGKHNDLEEVGLDSYHHTMFEMLGNWSFGDYFKKEAIEWAWELLTKELGIPEERLYATVFGGDETEGLDSDDEAASHWSKIVPKERILYFGKKDNFWEMGNTGPCGPCSEIHMDLRSDEDLKSNPGMDLVNKDDPRVVEIWNLVFIQYNRKSDGSLKELPDKHVDTGMGFERLCMVLQGKKSTYETDVFSYLIQKIEEKSGLSYTNSYNPKDKSDIAMRVICDHIRAVAFTIADGELPSNTGAGYVIRRILRRAVRYYYSFLDIDQPFLHELAQPLASSFKNVFPELFAQADFVTKVILEEEKSFLRTLEGGLKRLDQMNLKEGQIPGQIAFELYDTYGFPIDLTRLIAGERGLTIDETGFDEALKAQKERSRADAKKTTGDWVNVSRRDDIQFVGYDHQSIEDAHLIKYRTVIIKDKPVYHVVLDKTPFYAESGGQVGDTGRLFFGDEEIKVLDTKKENELIVHQVNKLPVNSETKVVAQIDAIRRNKIINNHTATHLLHAALRAVLGDHVHQKGSLVAPDHLRFDFSHFQKLIKEELHQIELIVNQKIRENISRGEYRDIPIEEAKAAGAMMLFGEKYGDHVRMITFDPAYSVELCGGCHVEATGQIGYFKITHESSIAAGVRRIEALTAIEAETFSNQQLEELNAIRNLFKNPLHIVKQVTDLQEENKSLKRELEGLKSSSASAMVDELKNKFEQVGEINVLLEKVPLKDSKLARNLAYKLEESVNNAFILFGLENEGKAQLTLRISEDLVKSHGLDAGKIIRELSSEIRGGGGGQAFYATAGGSDPDGIDRALEKARNYL